MLQSPFIFFLLVFGYFQTGYWLARLSWKIWHERETPGVLGHLLFPLSSVWLGFGPSTMERWAPIEGLQRRVYELAMANVWPFKVAWNVLALAILALLGAITAVCLGATATLKALVYGPERFVRWMNTAAKRGHVRSLGGIGGILPVAVPPAPPTTDVVAQDEGGGDGIR